MSTRITEVGTCNVDGTMVRRVLDEPVVVQPGEELHFGLKGFTKTDRHGVSTFYPFQQDPDKEK